MRRRLSRLFRLRSFARARLGAHGALFLAGLCIVAFQNCGRGFAIATDAGFGQFASQAVCSFNGSVVPEGQNVIAYLTSTVAANATCASEKRTCANGALTGSYTYASCSPGTAASCLFNGQTIAPGASVTAYASATVSAGATCAPLTRVCQNGVLSGTGDFASCAPVGGGACVLNGESIPDGGRITKFVSTDVSAGQSCASETRVCQNGTLSGSATANFCVVHAGLRLSSLVTTPGQDVIIPAGTTYEIDQAPKIGLLQVQGQLLCPNGGAYTLNVQGIQVYGSNALFQCGTDGARYSGQLDILLNGGRQVMGAERSFVAFNGGTIRLVGQNRNVNWFRLAQTAEAGSRTVTMTGGEGWAVGDHVALAPTGFDPHEAEEAVIAAVSGGGAQLTLAAPLKYRHWGGVQSFTSPKRTWSVDESAEVVNLTRNIRVEAPGDGPSLDFQGGHLMIMAGAFGYADAIELTHMGQMGKMARYPFHWHRAGNVFGQYIVNSSIHDSFQRCVTVHGTNNALVKNNVCYDHYGHGYFLEDGNETGNQFINNVGILTKKPLPGRQLLQSDLDISQLPRWAGPSTFWMSNPNNVFTGNVAAGSEGTGFWGSYVDQVFCDDTACRVVTDGTGNVFPSKAPLGQFDRNVARSALVGLSWDGGDQGDLTNNPNNPNDRSLVNVHYSPPSAPTVNGNAVSKSAMTGIYFRGQPFTFNETVLADNTNSLWLAYNQTVQNAVIVARTANRSDADDDVVANLGGDLTFAAGVWVYDGPMILNQVDFINFPTAAKSRNGVDITSVPFKGVGAANRNVHRAQGLSFTPEPWHRVLFPPVNWSDSTYSMTIRDVDGSLAGIPDTVLTVDHGFNTVSQCQPIPGTRATRCPYRPANLLMPGLFFPFTMSRSDGPRSATLADLHPATTVGYFNKLGLITGYGIEYTLRFGVDVASTHGVGFAYQTETVGILSPVIRMADIGTGCSLSNASAVGSIDEVRAATSSVYFQSGQDLWVHLLTNAWNPQAPGASAMNGFYLSCGGPASMQYLASPVVFNPETYVAMNHDLAGMSDADLRSHWVNHGIAEGRVAEMTFSVNEYMAMYPDVVAATNGDLNAIVGHYIEHGWAERRAGRLVTHPFVYVQSEYQKIYPDLSLMSEEEARAHWIYFGVGEGRQGSNQFSSKSYLLKNPDVAAAVGAQNYAGAIGHYVLHGAAEGRAGN